MLNSYPKATPQCLAAMCAATSKSDNPTIATAGAIVSGVMYFKTNPMMPETYKVESTYILYNVLQPFLLLKCNGQLLVFFEKSHRFNHYWPLVLANFNADHIFEKLFEIE
jgi:hypothetical protein